MIEQNQNEATLETKIEQVVQKNENKKQFIESHEEKKENSLQKTDVKKAKNRSTKKFKDITFKIKAGPEMKDEYKKICEDLLKKANDKAKGREVSEIDLILCGLKKINDSDIDSLQNNSYDLWDKIHLELEGYNKKNGSDLDLESYIAKKMKIQ